MQTPNYPCLGTKYLFDFGQVALPQCAVSFNYKLKNVWIH